MVDVLVIGAGPAGLLAATVARRRGATVRLVAGGIGITHIMPGWLGLWDCDGDPLAGVADRIAMGDGHPYVLAGVDGLEAGLAALSEACEPAGLRYMRHPDRSNWLLPTSLGMTRRAALVPESFSAGDLRTGGEMAIAGPQGWRDFYPSLCAENLERNGFPARPTYFSMPELDDAHFDPVPAGLARLFDRPDVRARVAGELSPKVRGAARVGFPSVLGLHHHPEAWSDLQERLGLPVFEIPTLPASVPGLRLYLALKTGLERDGVELLLDMPCEGVVEDRRCTAVAVQGPSRRTMFRAERFVLATGGLYGGGIVREPDGTLRETVFGLPVAWDAEDGPLCDVNFMTPTGHLAHRLGLAAAPDLRPMAAGEAAPSLENVYLAGRILAGANPFIEGSTEGIWLATGYRAGVAVS